MEFGLNGNQIHMAYTLDKRRNVIMYQILSWIFCLTLLFNAIKGHSFISLCGSVAVLFVLVVVAPYIWALSMESDAELEDGTEIEGEDAVLIKDKGGKRKKTKRE